MRHAEDASETSITIAASNDAVFDALSDAATYPEWLVGAKRIRRVDDGWPCEGAGFHHSVGAGPLTIDDRTTILRFDPPHELRLRAGVGPLGAAEVRFVLTVESGDATRLTFEERPVAGIVRALWGTVGRPLLRLGLWGRNEVSVRQLEQFVEADDARRRR